MNYNELGFWQILQERFSKPRLKWKEPRSFVRGVDRYRDRQAQWWSQPKVMIFLVSIAMLKWVAYNSHHSSGSLSLWITSILVMLFAYVGAYGSRLGLYPSWVKIRAHTISQKVGYRTLTLALQDLRSYSLDKDSTEAFYILTLSPRNASPFVFAIPDAATRDKVDAILREAGLTSSAS